MFSKLFWIDTAERTIRTAAQSFLGGFSAGAVLGLDGYLEQLAAGGIAALVGATAALVTALAVQGVGDKNSASAVLEVKKP